MVRLFFTLLVTLISFSSFVIEDDHSCLKVKGIVLDKTGKKISNVDVTLYENGQEISKLNTAVPFKMPLVCNRYYSMIIKASGHLPSLIVFDTTVPENQAHRDFQYQFECKLVGEENNYNKNYLDFPSAIIKYVKAENGFTHSEKYNKHIKKLVGIKM